MQKREKGTSIAPARSAIHRVATSRASPDAWRGSRFSSECCTQPAPQPRPARRSRSRGRPAKSSRGRWRTATSSRLRWPTRPVRTARSPSTRSSSRSTIRFRLTPSSSESMPMTTCTTCWPICRRFASPLAYGVISVALALACCRLVNAQGLDPAALLQPPAGRWPTYHGDYSGQRHSRLTQITPDNVRLPTLAWTFQTGQTQQIKSTPILVDGVIYVTTPDNIWALDARSARQLWRYTYPANQGFHIGHRGAAVYKDSVFLTTPDAHLVALDANTGKVKWNVEIADARRGFWSTNAPLVARTHILVGVSGYFDNLPGTLKSFAPE